MKTASIRPFESDYQRVMKKRTIQLGPWTILASLVLLIVLVMFIGVPLGKRAWDYTFNLPELYVDTGEEGRVVKVVEADGRAYTRASDSHFDERVQKILDRGRYERVPINSRVD